MKFPFIKKDFCLWIVPSSDGSVRKFRLTGLKIATVLGLTGLLTATLLVVASDYSRVQMLRAKSYLSLQRISYERDSLEKHAQNLETEIEVTKNINDKVVSYQQGFLSE